MDWTGKRRTAAWSQEMWDSKTRVVSKCFKLRRSVRVRSQALQLSRPISRSQMPLLHSEEEEGQQEAKANAR